MSGNIVRLDDRIGSISKDSVRFEGNTNSVVLILCNSIVNGKNVSH